MRAHGCIRFALVNVFNDVVKVIAATVCGRFLTDTQKKNHFLNNKMTNTTNFNAPTEAEARQEIEPQSLA